MVIWGPHRGIIKKEEKRQGIGQKCPDLFFYTLDITKFSIKDPKDTIFETQRGASAPIATPGDAHDAIGKTYNVI